MVDFFGGVCQLYSEYGQVPGSCNMIAAALPCTPLEPEIPALATIQETMA